MVCPPVYDRSPIPAVLTGTNIKKLCRCAQRYCRYAKPPLCKLLLSRITAMRCSQYAVFWTSGSAMQINQQHRNVGSVLFVSLQVCLWYIQWPWTGWPTTCTLWTGDRRLWLSVPLPLPSVHQFLFIPLAPSVHLLSIHIKGKWRTFFIIFCYENLVAVEETDIVSI